MRNIYPLALLIALAGCGPDPAPAPNKPLSPAAPAAAASPAPLAAAAPSAQPQAQLQPPAANPRQADVDLLNKAVFDPSAAPPAPATANKHAPPDSVIVKAEVLLARAHFSPGVIDGKDGTNYHHALAAYQSAHNLEETGKLDADTWNALSANPGAPVATTYVVNTADIQGPFAPDVGEDFVKLAAQEQGPLYSTTLEALAERFHMSQSLLTALNPSADLKTAGQTIVVVDAEAPPFQRGDVKTVSVSKADEEVTAYGGDDQVLGVYPATVGSTERPSPTGVHKVTGVSRDPDYKYDPAKLHWGPRQAGVLLIKPGPNNPVGTTWIGLNAPGYGIHGTPDPDKIGKTASHGCVRMTNWDANALGAGIRAGIQVSFVGSRATTGAKRKAHAKRA